MTPSNAATWLGRRLGERERYRLDQQLGGGAIGDVYLAMDLHLGRRVAIKLLKGALTHSKELLARFEREVIISAALESEHIVQVLDYGITPEGNPFYVMQYLKGRTLDQCMRKTGRLSIEQTIRIAAQLCEGLQLAHSGVMIWRNQATVGETVKVVHRDLKPANIFLVPTALGELVKILDFGIAKKLHDDRANQTNLTQAFLGTFHYAAPEQLINAAKADERSDIYSLGMILYEMLTGTNPYSVKPDPRQAEVNWARAHTSTTAIPLRQQPGCEQLPEALEAAIMRCLEKPASQRFATVTELSQALRSIEPARDRTPISTAPPIAIAASEEPTIHKPLVQAPIPDQTLVQSRSKPQAPDVTILQTPKANKAIAPDATILQIPTPTPDHKAFSALPASNASPDATIVQVPPSIDKTIVQGRGLTQSRSSDATILQPRRQSPDATILQPRRQSESTIVQPTLSRPDSVSKRSNSSGNFQTILLLAIGFLLGLSMMGGVYLYFRPQSPAQQQQR